MHECIEALNNGKSWKKVVKQFEKDFIKNTFEEERVEMGDLPAMVNDLMENYEYHYKNDNLKYLKNEEHFLLPLTQDIEIEGYIDSVVEWGRGTWAKETKTYGRMPDREFLMFNPQSGIYIWAMSELGYKNPRGTIWDIIKAKQPAKPKLTAKTGKLSVAKCDSTPYTVTKGIVELGLNPKDYTEFIQKHSFEDFFVRKEVLLNKNVVNAIMKDVVDTAKEIYSRGEYTKDRNLSKDCSWCSYKSICQAELMDLDVDYIIEKEYKKREKNDVKKEKSKKPKKRNRRKV